MRKKQKYKKIEITEKSNEDKRENVEKKEQGRLTKYRKLNKSKLGILK